MSAIERLDYISRRNYERLRQDGMPLRLAYQYALARQIADERGWKFRWEPDEMLDMDSYEVERFRSYVDYLIKEKGCGVYYAERYVERQLGEYYVEYCVLEDENGEHLASVGGVVNSHLRHYGRMIEMELAYEVVSPEWQAEEVLDSWLERIGYVSHAPVTVHPDRSEYVARMNDVMDKLLNSATVREVRHG